MNALMGENRAIVTNIPGTTRDTIEESITIRDIPVILTDTAGIHETEDVIEQIGIEKSKESFNNADLVIFMLDASEPLAAEDNEIFAHMGERKAIVLLNKTDIDKKIDESEIKSRLKEAVVIETAVKEGIGISKLADTIEEMVYGGEVTQKSSLLVTNVRHKNILEESNQSIKDALDLIDTWQPLEFIEIDVNRCYELLGEIIGETAADDIIEKVFERFCLGK